MEARTSADGRFVVFQTGVNLTTVNLPGGFAETTMTQVFLRDMLTGQFTLISINRAGNAPGNGSSGSPMISDDGRFVVFASAATDLVANSTARGIFVYDAQTGFNSLVAPGGSLPFISANGRTIVFQRYNNSVLDKDIFAYDMETGATETVTPSHTGGASNGPSELPQYEDFYGQKLLDRSRKILSDDGRYVVYTSAATNLVALPDTNGRIDVFVRDLQTDTTMLVSVNSAGTDTGRNEVTGRGDSFGAAISSDGRLVAFSSRAKDLVAGTPPGGAELFVRDLEGGTTEVVSVRGASPEARPGDSTSGNPSFSRDGRYLAFLSYASDIVPNDNNGNGGDVFVRDLQTDTTTLVSVNSAGTGTGDRGSTSPQISANGRFVAFASSATNLDAGVMSVGGNVFVRDLQAGVTRLLSVDSSGTADAGSSFSPSITADGELVFFESTSQKLVTKGERFTTIGAYAGYITEYFAALSAAPSRLVFESARYNVGEDGGSVTVTVTRNGATNDAVSADYMTQDGTARAGRDYTATSGSVAFAPGETTKTITIPILDGNIDQPDDAFFVYLNDFNYGPLPTVLSTAMIVIADNDEMPALSISDVNVVEGDSERVTYNITATLSEPSRHRVTFSVRRQEGGTATPDVDYRQQDVLVFGSFEPGETTKTLTATNAEIFGDRTFELDETIRLKLNIEANAVVGDGEAVVTILNDDLAPTLIVDDITTTENLLQVHTGIMLTNPTYLPVTVQFTTMDGTALAGEDYAARTATLTFSPGSMFPDSAENFVQLHNHFSVEPTETFSVVISNATNAAISDPEGVITILDDDASPVEFALTSVFTSEGSSGRVRVVRRGALGSSVSVDYRTYNGTATAGMDYAAQTGTLVFAPGESEKTLIFVIADDLSAESTETFAVSLSNPNGAVLGDKTLTQVHIQDNDGCIISLSPSALPQFTAAGANSVNITVQRPSAACPYTAVSHSDFITNVTTSSSTVNFRVAPNPNAESRTGTLTIAGQTLIIRQSGTASGSAFEFESPTYPAVEGARNVAIKVLRRGDTNGAASVRFRTVDDPAAVPCDPTATQAGGVSYPRGTAYGRCDYATTVETLTWAAGDSDPKTITIPLIDDSHAEGTETFQIGLSDPQGGDVGGIGAATITLSDNDAAPGANPIRDHAFFVRQHYLDFLSREPEAGEPWTAVLNRCPNPFNIDAGSPSALCDRILVSSSFYLAPEFRLKGFYAFLFYRAAFDRRPEYSEIVVDMRDVTGETPEEVFQKRAAFAAAFAQRPEFKARYDALSNADYVAALLARYNAQQITTEDPQQPESTTQVTLTRQQLTDALNGNTLTRAQVLRAVVQSDESARDEFHGAFVAMQYYGYLRRTPEPEGYNAWLRVIREDPNNVRVMIDGFLNSPEYALRFGPR